MSNTPRFRVWDKKYSKMYYEGICVYEDGSFDLDRTSGASDKIEVASSDSGELVLMPSVGLKDKNCKRIYEGDIVRCVNDHVGIVEWEAHDCCFNVSGYYSTGDDYPTMAFIEGQPFEVIGNVFENPELLEA